MRTIDITFDLETTSLQSTAAIMSFGAVAWNREAKSNPFLLNDNMAIGCNDGFGRYIILAPHLSQQFVSGFDFDRNTARWWNSQSDDAKDAIIIAEPVRCERLFVEFYEWLLSVLDFAGADSYRLWCQGADFDLAIFLHFLSVFDTDHLIKIHHCYFRDARTFTLEAVETIFKTGKWGELVDTPDYTPDDFRANPQTIYAHLPQMTERVKDLLDYNGELSARHSVLFDAAQSSWNVWLLQRCVDAVIAGKNLPMEDIK